MADLLDEYGRDNDGLWLVLDRDCDEYRFTAVEDDRLDGAEEREEEEGDELGAYRLRVEV